MTKKRILLATPMMPPTLGGPAIHAERISSYLSEKGYDLVVINFEKFSKYPPGLRHFLFFLNILLASFSKDLIFAFDGFSVAFPTVLAGKIVGKKVVVRTVGDLVHEQYVEKVAIPYNDFYQKIASGIIKLNFTEKLKLKIQKWSLENAYGIIFATNWQRNIFLPYYNLPENFWIISNPKEKIPENLSFVDKKNYTFISATRDVKFKNLDRLKKAFNVAKEKLNNKVEISLDTKTSSRSELLERIYNSRCYVCVSISDIFPNTVIDALSLGIPAILTKNTGLYDLLIDKGCCIFVNPFSQSEIEKAILDMCDDNIWQQLKRNLDNFSWPETWESLFLRYTSLIEEVTKK